MSSTGPSSAPRRNADDPPGGVLTWIIVVVELIAFSMVFAVICHLRLSDPAAFADGQRHLSPLHGVVLTVLLLLSGWLVAEAVHAHRADRTDRARRFGWAGALAGAGFLVLKIVDYAEKRAAGHWLGASDFWDAYVLATGFHFVHVAAGVMWLAYVASRTGRARFEDLETVVAGSGLFWHLCDVVWLFLVPLFYARS